jgi:hypothetical protein
MRTRSLPALFLSLAFLPMCLDAALAAKRVALLIGNAAYSGVTRLDNPSRDVAMIGRALEGAGFDSIDVKVDLDREGMIKALRQFEDKSFDADIAVVYFSGHGMELNGENFLLPVDARLATDRDVEDESVTLTRLLRTVDGAKKLKLIILDACRNNPFLAAMSQTRSTKAVSRGLAEIEPRSADTLVAYAAKAGTVAWDGERGASPFAQSLAKHLVEPGLDIRLALGKVRDEVLALTNNLQEPFAYGSLGGSMVTLAAAPPKAPAVTGMAAATAPASTAGKPDPCRDASGHWAEARQFDRIEFYRRHVELFASCPFADFARARIEALETKPAAASRVAASKPEAAPSSPPPAKKAVSRSVKPKRKVARKARPAPAAARREVAMADEVEIVEREPVVRRRSGPPITIGFGHRGGARLGFGGGFGGGGGIGIGW